MSESVEYFKRGQIVPRRLRFALTSDRKGQHSIVFGSDVKVKGRRVTLLSDGPAFLVRHKPTRRMSNGTRKNILLTVSGVHVDTQKPVALDSM